MPLPEPNDDESKDEFMERCMGDDLMVDEYPDNKQRYAVCNSIWEQEQKAGRAPVAHTRKEDTEMEQDIERRLFDVFEMRVMNGDGEEQKPIITGHAAVFDKLSESLFGFREKIAPGTFLKSIERDDIRALFNHDMNYVFGRNRSRTLRLEEDKKGLYIEIEPPDTGWARDVEESIRRGDISQMSFGFETIKDEWHHEQGKESIRTLLEVKLFDISIVTFPAYPQTSVKVRDYIDALKLGEGGVEGRSLSLARAKWRAGGTVKAASRSPILREER